MDTVREILSMKHTGGLMLVGVGGFLGSVARYGVTLLVAPVVTGFPLPTLLVNILGSFLIGFLGELAISTTLVTPEARLFLVTGFCGGFTTFSAYMFENTALLKDGQLFYAAIYLAGSIAGGFIALYTGTLLAKLWT
jgi:CrcB protein